MLRPLEPVSRRAQVVLGISFFVLFVAAWAAATLSGAVSPTFLADPITMLEDGWTLLTRFGFGVDIAVTVWRVVGGFILAALVAVPLGILMGAYKSVEAFFEPFVSFARYLPASAFVPLLILWAGIGETQKLLVIFIGSVFQIILMVAVAVGGTRRGLVEAAYTLGASDRGVVRRVLIPANAPDIAETLRLVLGWAWTYVIVAEFIGSSSGIGHMIIESQALLATGQIIFGIIVIGLIGLISDFLFKWLNQRLFPWRRADARRRTGPARGRRERFHHHPRTVRLREVDASAHRRRPRPAERRACAARRPPGDAPRARPRHGLPILHAVSLAHRHRQHRLRPAREGRAGGAAPRDHRSLCREGRVARLREPLPEAAFRRHAAAHRHRPRARQRPRDPPPRRAFRRP